MNGVVSSLYDIDSIVIPEDMLQVCIDEQRVEDDVRSLSIRFAKESPADQVEKGDLAYCQADKESYPDQRTVLIYTGLDLPGAEEAKAAVIGKKAGDSVSCKLAGKNVILTVQKVLRRTPVEVDDALIAGMGLEGVTTVAAYKDHVRERLTADQEMENSKMAVALYIRTMTENSTYTYDEKEMEAYVQSVMAEYVKEAEEVTGETVDEAEVKEGIVSQCEQMWMAEAFCKSRGVAVDLSGIKADTDQMIEMMELMGEEIPDRAEMEEMARQDAYFGGFVDYVSKIVEEKMGGSYGDR